MVTYPFNLRHYTVLLFLLKKSRFLTVSVILAPIGQLELAGECPAFPVSACRGSKEAELLRQWF